MTSSPKNYLVIWRGDDQVIQTEVSTCVDPATMANLDWLRYAVYAEEENEAAAAEYFAHLEQVGYDLYLVIDMPEKTYETT